MPRVIAYVDGCNLYYGLRSKGWHRFYSVQLMSDAFQDRFDTALLISADSDRVGPLQTVRRLFPTKEIIVVFPPNRASDSLKQVADLTLHIGQNDLAKSQFPQTVVKPSGSPCSVRRHGSEPPSSA